MSLMLIEVTTEQAGLVENAQQALSAAQQHLTTVISAIAAGHVPERSRFSQVMRGPAPADTPIVRLVHADGNGKDGPLTMLAFAVPEVAKEGA